MASRGLVVVLVSPKVRTAERTVDPKVDRLSPFSSSLESSLEEVEQKD